MSDGKRIFTPKGANVATDQYFARGRINATRKSVLGRAKLSKKPVTLARTSIEQDTLDGIAKCKIEDSK